MQVQLRAMRKVGSDVINPCFKVDTAVSRFLDCGVRWWINCLRLVLSETVRCWRQDVWMQSAV
jgi:hypothetical protein